MQWQSIPLIGFQNLKNEHILTLIILLRSVLNHISVIPLKSSLIKSGNIFVASIIHINTPTLGQHQSN